MCTKLIAFTSLLFLFNLHSYAQSLEIATKESLSLQPLAYVNGVITKDDFKVIFFTNKEGAYHLKDIKPGMYNLLLSSIGYKNIDTTFQIISEKNNKLEFLLHPEFEDLKDIAVVSKKPFLQMDKGKFILNVQESALAKTSSVWDALKYAPTVRTTSTGTVTIQNKGTVVFLDNRRLYITGIELMNYLQNIPSSNIEKVEIIQHPDATYAADIPTVIKIYTDKLKYEGIKGSANLRTTFATFPIYNSGGNLDFKKGKFSSQVGYSFNKAKTQIMNDYEKEGNSTLPWNIQQKSNNDQLDNRIYTTLGYDFNKKSQLTLYFDIPFSKIDNHTNADNGIPTTERITVKDSIFKFNNVSKTLSNSFQSQAIYENRYDSTGKSIKVQLEYFNNYRNLNNNYNTFNYIGHDYSLKNGTIEKLPQTLTTMVGTVTHSTSIFNENIQYGLRFNRTNISMDNSTETFNNNNSSPISLTQNVKYIESNIGLFGSWEKQINKMYFQLGVRAENNKISSIASNIDSTVNYNWLNIFPKVLVQYLKSDKSAWILMYSKDFTRPDYALLNPYLRYTNNSAAQFRGDMKILPQKNHYLTLSWTDNKKVNLSIGSLIYKNFISTLFLKDSFNNLYRKYDNFQFKSIFISAYYGTDIAKWWRMSIDGSVLFYSLNYADIAATTKATPMHSISLLNSFSLPKSFKVELSTFYNGQYDDGYFLHYKQANIDFAVVKDFANSKFSAGIFGNDIFRTNSYKQKANYLHYIESGYMDSQRFGFNVTWRFGKQTISVKQTENLETDSSKKRLKN